MNMTLPKFKYIHKLQILVVLSMFFLACEMNKNEQITTHFTAIQANPEIFKQNDLLVLKFPQHHPENLSIKTPENVWYSIQSSDDKAILMAPEKYRQATELKININELEGVAWKNGVKVKEKVFSEQGEYLIYMADNMETEPENTFHFMKRVHLQKN